MSAASAATTTASRTSSAAWCCRGAARRSRTTPSTTTSPSASGRQPRPSRRAARRGGGALRRRVVRPLAIAIHRLGARLVQALVRPGPPDGFEGVRILLMHAYGMGGTIRTADPRRAPGAARAGRDRQRRAPRDEPFFAFPDGVAVTVLDDRRGRGASGARQLPSLLVHPDDYAYAKLQPAHRRARCCAACAACAAASLVTTRPGFNLLAARLAPRGADGRRPGAHELQRAPARRSRATSAATTARLDALAVLTEDDGATTRAARRRRARASCRSPTRCPSSAAASPRPRPGRRRRRAADAQKGFDLLIEAFAPVAARASRLAAADLRRGPAARPSCAG